MVVEPTAQSILTGRRIRRIAASRDTPIGTVLVVNKVRTSDDVQRVETVLGESLAAVPADAGVASAEREGAALLDHAPDSAAVAAIAGLAELLERSSLEG